MLFYYTIWFFISFFSFISPKNPQAKIFYIFFIVFLTIVTGLRYQIGADWTNYLNIYDYFKGLNFFDSLLITDPGYGILNYLSQYIGFKDTIFVNSICGLLFFICIYKVSISFKNYWLTLLICYSYLILVVSMGYTRQSVAIALGLLAFKYLLNKKYNKYFISILLAFLFHKSAIILLAFSPLIILNNFFNKKVNFYIYTLLSFIILTGLIYYSSISGENMYTDTSSDISSAGAILRIAVHFLPLSYYFIYREKIKKYMNDRIVVFDYLSIMIFYILGVGLIFSTLADRFNLYLIIYDVFVLNILYNLFNTGHKRILVFTIFIFHSLILTIWLIFGAWAQAWLPYQNYLFNFILETF